MRIRFSLSFQLVVAAAAVGLMLGVVPDAAVAQDGAAVHIAFVGDSMADGLWGALFRRLGKDKCLADKVKLLRRAKNGTGLTRLDNTTGSTRSRPSRKIQAPTCSSLR